MRNIILLTFTICLVSALNGQKYSVTPYPVPDSVKGVQFMADINVQDIKSNKEIQAGIKTDLVRLLLASDGKEKEIVFGFPSAANAIIAGIAVKKDEQNELEWKYDWSFNETYRLLLAIASDSAENFTLYSGYILLPKENKWKLIGTCRIDGRWGNIKEPAVFHSAKSKKLLKQVTIQTNQSWLQRSNGSWKNLAANAMNPPVVNVTSHVDSLIHHKLDLDFIKHAIATGKTDATNVQDDIYYTMIKEGTGRQVQLTDTVVVYYKGSLLSDGSIFDQTKDKPATFPLNRLIKGWHIGVPLCKVGGKIKIVIPAALGYSIRTRAAKIPPGSILVFEVEVVDTKPKL